MTIATGNTGGVYYVLGGGLAQLISNNTKLRATAAETGASVQNIQQLAAGDYDIAFTLADTAPPTRCRARRASRASRSRSRP
ncbi:TAXI family TRAP transporter solute-binding subunit [Saccharopolyspora pogona]|uniref:TAXI family TRAP transporter solute-binding subunit n=1 Tax=Saccharopolyspora pogona TaxID=333966 RepID=UPI0021E00920|nr:TAXI family TRAP transporter solute-binding subunit [Saccharopolyspora pogona]